MVYAQSYPMSAKVTNSESTKISTENFKASLFIQFQGFSFHSDGMMNLIDLIDNALKSYSVWYPSFGIV